MNHRSSKFHFFSLKSCSISHSRIDEVFVFVQSRTAQTESAAPRTLHNDTVVSAIVYPRLDMIVNDPLQRQYHSLTLHIYILPSTQTRQTHSSRARPPRQLPTVIASRPIAIASFSRRMFSQHGTQSSEGVVKKKVRNCNHYAAFSFCTTPARPSCEPNRSNSHTVEPLSHRVQQKSQQKSHARSPSNFVKSNTASEGEVSTRRLSLYNGDLFVAHTHNTPRSRRSQLL
jgi:hypothetical protein